jgi:phosphohistidine phosphatase
MLVLLMRHGHAVDVAPGVGDAGRWLSKRGRKVTRKVARLLCDRRRRTPLTIWTSPLVRAVQTAEIVAAEAAHKDEIRAVAELSLGRDPNDLVRIIADEMIDAGRDSAFAGRSIQGPLLLVGHEPSLSLLASLLTNGAAPRHLRKSEVLGLMFQRSSPCSLRFTIDPETLVINEPVAPPP